MKKINPTQVEDRENQLSGSVKIKNATIIIISHCLNAVAETQFKQYLFLVSHFIRLKSLNHVFMFLVILSDFFPVVFQQFFGGSQVS